MSWEDNLLEASFRGVTFDCISTDDRIARATAENSYPYLDDTEIEDMGAAPRTISLEAIFYGKDYEDRLNAFIDVLETPGAGELVHPVFGAINVQFNETTLHHEADAVDQVKFTLSFTRSTSEVKLFDKTLAVQKASAITQNNDNTREAAAGLLNKEVTKVLNTSNFNRIEQLRSTMVSALASVKNMVQGVITSGLDPLNYATSWASDLTSLISGIVDLRSFDLTSLTADWKSVFDSMDTAILLPTQPAQPVRDQQVIAANIALEQANGKADAASIVLASETQTPTLSAIEIEAMVNDARTSIEDVIIQYRAIYTIEDSRPITESLKSTALTLQEAARAVIESRPPLVIRIMTAPGNLRLIAHKLYADHTRAIELYRLNPQIKSPNFIDRGDVLNVYSA